MKSATRREQVLALARHEAAQGRRVLIGTYKPVAELLRSALAEAPDANIHIAHFGAIRGLDGWKDFDTVIVAGREQPPPLAVENMARSLFGADPEPLLLTGDYVPQMRGHRTKDGSRTAVVVQVHPDLRVQALVEQVREREIEQMVGRLRLVHRDRPARVLLLTNLPTALPVDRFTTWEGIMPGKMEQAIVRGRGVLPLSDAELARVHPDLWATAKEVEHWLARKGPQVPIRESILECGDPFGGHLGELPPAGAAARFAAPGSSAWSGRLPGRGRGSACWGGRRGRAGTHPQRSRAAWHFRAGARCPSRAVCDSWPEDNRRCCRRQRSFGRFDDPDRIAPARLTATGRRSMRPEPAGQSWSAA